MNDLFVNTRLSIPAGDLNFTAARSSGPGGQNVNKVNSKVTLRWSLADCRGFDPGWRRRFINRYQNRITRDGELLVHSERYRDQARNLADARTKLAEMLLECQAPPTPRKATKPTRGSQRRRLDKKRQNSQKKHNRRGPRMDD
ncbi:peptidyl-tRNA hydrolase domain protein [Rhodopirellula maiorica SM1]|uniref:Peptidyl-tRNA hydrolase domain protein n=1 Tax=Rhodopirellula maiorica SM1 TaxID=1265738 RepID=M5RV44_9BACT|nr:alternative ribosome rescue aminoacyl-tRNA hydrolase ArfB [Rhodopirellula maiorica]EMI17804.1 peptidyl-tRNA hydrolase domain protein [Rhodopirellula maiorica SM1]